MNKQIRWVGLVSALLVFALLANLSYLNIFKQSSLEADPDNRRAREAEFDIQRGQILAGSLAIADSVESKDNAFRYRRVYANGPLYAQITGFYSYIYGSSRVENSFNDYLIGSSSSQWLQNLIDIMSGRSPQGASITTTIVPALQEAAWDALTGYRGAILAMDPHSGAIKALVSSPSYDPSLLADQDLGASQEAWERLTTDPSRPMTDRGTREIYPPGSTFKLVVAAAALERGYTAETLIDTPSKVQLPNSEVYLPNSGKCGDGQQTLSRALQLSCNTSFALLGQTLGADALRTQAIRFGFESDHLPELGGVASHFPDEIDDAQLMLSSIGQFDVAASPLQIAMVTAAFVNSGKVPEPYLVEEVRAPDLSLLYKHDVNTSVAVSSITAQTMAEMMIDVVNLGNGSKAAIPGVSVGGKSGTAETDIASPNIAWFTSFALNPDIVVVVFLQRDESTPENLWGGANAAPLAKKVMEASR